VTVGSTVLAATGLTASGVAGQAVLTVTALSQVAVFSLSLLGVLLIGRAALTYDDLPLKRAGTLIVTGLGVTSLPFWWLLVGTVSTPTILSLTTTQLVATGGALFLGQFGTRLFTDRPLTGHLARETILDTMSESVIIADQNDRILDANEQAAETFGVEQSQLPDRRTTDIGITPAMSDDVVVLDTNSGVREFRVSRTPLSAPRGSPVGYSYRLRDVTDKHTQEQKLEVFNRILRHNLRNDLDAIRGFAEAIRADGGEPGHADRVVDISGELVELTAQLETANKVLTDHTPAAEACDLVAVAEAAAETARARAGAGTDAVTVTVTTTADEPVRVETDPKILRFALAELITNGLKHSTEPAPELELRLEDRPDGASVAVCDDGPGLPANERAVLVAGEETPLRHGRGIGLWTVRWAVKRLGGELAVADRDPTGTTVTVRVPDGRVR
jgi:Signal transduction histidine kinase